jgi:uncharacterized protein
VNSSPRPRTVNPSRYWGSRIRIRLNRRLLDYSRTVHIYLSMFGLLVMFLFGLTGFTVNHEDWFGATTPRVHESEVRLAVELLTRNDRLAVVEHLRRSLRITGAMTAFEDLDSRFSIGFKEPGQIWEIEIEKGTGVARVHRETFNFTAVINNLHRGRYSGAAWRWVIDISAILIVMACGTGMVLWLVLPRRRVIGALALVLGVIGTGLIYLLLVPGADVQLNPAAENVNPTESRTSSAVQ